MEAVPTLGADPPPPTHVAIIMDGNGRWARARNLPRVAGHRRGAEVVRRIVRHCGTIGVGYLTLYVFSSENWKRPPNEVRDLMGLLRLYLRRELDELDREHVRMRFIGDRSALAPDIRTLVEGAEARTAANRGLTLVVALNYGGRRELVEAARRLAREVAVGRLTPDAIDEVAFASALDTAGIPDPDLVIRTSGEQRLSNFLLWQTAYSELVFVPELWPDFDEARFDAAVEEYHRRERRYGGAGG